MAQMGTLFICEISEICGQLAAPLPKGAFEEINSSQQTVPASLEAARLDASSLPTRPPEQGGNRLCLARKPVTDADSLAR